MNHKFLIMTMLICALCITARSQDPAGLERFAGAWKRDTGTDRIITIKVSQYVVELSETYVAGGRTYMDKGVYYADKRGEKNVQEITDGGTRSEVRSKTEYKNGKLVIDLAYSVEYRGTRGEFRTTDHKSRWEFLLSADTQTLSLNKRSTFSTRLLSMEEIGRGGAPNGPMSLPSTAISKEIYKRQN